MLEAVLWLREHERAEASDVGGGDEGDARVSQQRDAEPVVPPLEPQPHQAESAPSRLHISPIGSSHAGMG